MINDNRYCINGIVDIVKEYIRSINQYMHEDKPKIELDKVSVIYPESETLTDYLGKSSCQAKIKFSYHTYLGEKSYSPKSESIHLPLLIDGIYVLNGKCKLPLNWLVNDTKCIVYANKIIISKDITFYKDKGLLIRLDADSKEFTPVDFETIDPELLKIDDYTSKKLALLFKLDEFPEYFNQELVETMQANFKSDLRDHAINKKILTPEMALLRNLNISRSKILDGVRGKYYQSLKKKHDNHGTLNLKTLENAIIAFFNGNDQFFSGIQNPTNSNPLIFESMKSKIIFENNSDKINSGGNNLKIPYSKYDLSFYGIVDPSITPDNQNSSRQNELTRCIVIKNGDTYFKCYDKEWNMVEVKFIDYVSAKVLMSSEVDYDFHEIPEKDKYKVKFLYREIESPDYDYIELSPDWRLSLSGSQIPMVNLSDSVRVGMGGKMINQAIGVIGGQRPRVSSGNDVLDENPFVIRFEDNTGEVQSVDSGVITIKLPDGSLVSKSVPKPVKGNNGVNITFEANVTEGDKISRGDVLVKPTSFTPDNQLRLGVNARVAMMAYRGYTFEDALVVSESFAKKMTHITVEDVKIEITPDIMVEGYADVMSKVTSRTPLINGRKRKSIEGASKTFRQEIGLDKRYYVPWSVSAPMNIDEGYIYDMKIVEGDTPSKHEETDFWMDKGRSVQLDRRMEFGDFPEVDLDDANLQLISDFKATPGSSYTIKYRIVVFHKLKAEDKLTNRYGSKGVVGLVLPDSKMPRDLNGRPVDAIMNPDAPLSRKNIPQTMEIEINQLMTKVFEINSELLAKSDFDGMRANFKKYRMPHYYKMSDEELKAYHENNSDYEYITGSFSRVNPKDISTWKDELGIQSGITLIDGITGKKIRQPIMVEDMYLLKLYFLADAYAKVTSEYIPGVKSMVLGKGGVTKRGSKHGNMEMDAIQSCNILNYAKRMKSSDGYSAGWLLANALLTGLMFRSNTDDSED